MPSSTDDEKKTAPGSKGDYSLVIDTDERKTATLSSQVASSAGLGDSLLNHPALPVMCYCAASILMTVINKVSPHRSLVPAGMLAHACRIRSSPPQVCRLWVSLLDELPPLDDPVVRWSFVRLHLQATGRACISISLLPSKQAHVLTSIASGV